MCIHEDILNWIYIILVMWMILSSMSILDIWDTHNHFKTDIWVKPNDAKFIAWAYSLGNKCISVFIYLEILESSIWIYEYIKDTYGHIIPDMGYKPIQTEGRWWSDSGSEVPYLNTIGALIYLAKYVRPGIIFVGNILRVQFPTKGIMVGVRNILRYVQDTKGLD